ncbi:MAG: septum site-determining protein MinC [Firmicutes bacterium]|nr:septum site-determining protein MinC [Bacillota bacterium]
MPEPAMRQDVVIKGTRNGLLVVLNDEVDFETAKASLIERLGESGSFFQGANVTLDIGSRNVGAAELVELELMMDMSLGVHLEKVVRNQYRRTRSASGSANGSGVFAGASGGAGTATRAAPRDDDRAAVDSASTRPTMLVKRTIRSGQTIRFDGNVVVLGDANPGSEIAARGDIVVVGFLRGVAHAGAGGDESAIVAALRLAPTQLRIAGRISRPPEGPSNPTLPEIARLRGGVIVVETMSWIAGLSRASCGEE